MPALYIGGDRDVIVTLVGIDEINAHLAMLVPQLRETVILPGCGHWMQQERPQEVNSAKIRFLDDLV